MTIETLNINGENYKIEYEDVLSSEQKQNVINQILSQCLECKTNIGEQHVQSLNPVTCPTSTVRGTKKDILLKVTSGGIPPYTLKFYVDGIQKTVTPTWLGNDVLWEWTFNETVGSHAYAAEVMDSCVTGTKTSNRESCNINIVAPCPTPVVAMIIPS